MWMRLVFVLAMMLVLGGCVAGEKGKAAGAKPRPVYALPPALGKGDVNPALREGARQEIGVALNSEDPTLRMHGVEAARNALGVEARTDLLKALNDTDPAVRFAACLAVGELRLSEAGNRLRQLLNDKDPHVQIGVIFALHRLGDVRFSAGLEEALRSPVPEIRGNAAFALGRLGEKSALKILRGVLRDRSAVVRLQVGEAMWRLGDDEGLAYLVAAGLSGNAAYQMVAVLAMAETRDQRVIEHVRGGKDSDYVEVTLVSARALGMLGSDELFSLAMDSARGSEARYRYLGALALGAIGRWDAQDALASLLKDPDADVRLAAAIAILQLRGK